MTDLPDSQGLAQLATLATDLYLAEITAAEAVEKAKEAQRKVDMITHGTIPELMAELGLEEFKTSNGIKLEVKPQYRASILKARREEAYAWLDENGEGGMIKHNVIVGFAREQGDEARQLIDDLQENNYANVKDEEKVEAATLRAWVRQQLEDGKTIPMDLFGASRVDIAKITARPESMFGE